jgi:hypothetical protein
MYVTTIARVMSGHFSIRAHLERNKIVGNPICVYMMNYETVDHIIWKCSRFEVERCQLLGTRGREYKRGNLLTYLCGTTTNIWLRPVQEDLSMSACLEHSASNL